MDLEELINQSKYSDGEVQEMADVISKMTSDQCARITNFLEALPHLRALEPHPGGLREPQE